MSNVLMELPEAGPASRSRHVRVCAQERVIARVVAKYGRRRTEISNVVLSFPSHAGPCPPCGCQRSNGGGELAFLHRRAKRLFVVAPVQPGRSSRPGEGLCLHCRGLPPSPNTGLVGSHARMPVRSMVQEQEVRTFTILLSRSVFHPPPPTVWETFQFEGSPPPTTFPA